MFARRCFFIVTAMILFVAAVPFRGAAAEPVPDMQETLDDMKILWEGYQDVTVFQDEYRIELWKAGVYIDSFKAGDYLDKLNATMEAYRLISSERGKQMTRDGLAMYDAYGDHALRIVRKHCPVGIDGRISHEDIRRTSKKMAYSYMMYEWKQHPFAYTFMPWKLAAAYREGYDMTYKSLKIYQDAVELWYDENPISKIIRQFVGGNFDIDVDDYDIHDLIDLLNYDDFDPNDAFKDMDDPYAAPATDSRGIRLDRSEDF